MSSSRAQGGHGVTDDDRAPGEDGRRQELVQEGGDERRRRKTMASDEKDTGAVKADPSTLSLPPRPSLPPSYPHL
uniref:Uncharacterized protein n=1 Tax=Oryza meridionalis TaxID=40149 RepID=A0A0E0DZB4_9ORYZ